jgi:DNA-binding MarR family transcriptional regulator
MATSGGVVSAARPVRGGVPGWAKVASPVEALLRAHHAVSTRLDDVLIGQGLSVAKLGVLRQLANGPLPLGALAQRQSCVRSNITQLIDRMEAEELVRRRPDADDRRVTLAEITDAGRARLQAGLAAQGEAERALLGDLSPAESETLERLLARLATV